ncbi:MAG: hypothetical protein ACOYK9_05350 [Chlamydiia bacterium]
MAAINSFDSTASGGIPSDTFEGLSLESQATSKKISMVVASYNDGLGDPLMGLSVLKHMKQTFPASLVSMVVVPQSRENNLGSLPIHRFLAAEPWLPKENAFVFNTISEFEDQSETTESAKAAIRESDVVIVGPPFLRPEIGDYLELSTEDPRVVEFSEYGFKASLGSSCVEYGFGRGQTIPPVRPFVEKELPIGPLDWTQPYYLAYTNKKNLGMLSDFLFKVIESGKMENRLQLVIPDMGADSGVLARKIYEIFSQNRPEIAEKINFIRISGKGRRGYKGVFNEGQPKEVHIWYAFPTDNENFTKLIQHAEPPILITGDGSFADALSENKLFIYQSLFHKLTFIEGFYSYIRGKYPDLHRFVSDFKGINPSERVLGEFQALVAELRTYPPHEELTSRVKDILNQPTKAS